MQASTITGALRIAAVFLARCAFTTTSRPIFIPSPTTEEDTATLRQSGLDIEYYRFLNSRTGAVDFEGLREDLQVSYSEDSICHS